MVRGTLRQCGTANKRYRSKYCNDVMAERRLIWLLGRIIVMIRFMNIEKNLPCPPIEMRKLLFLTQGECDFRFRK